MKVVIDTNVLVSGTFFNGLPCQIIEAWRKKKFQLIVSTEIFTEYQQVLEILAKTYPSIEIPPLLDYISRNAVFYDGVVLSEQVSEDPDDDKFIACALASNCQIVISGDKHLLRISGYQNVFVLKPREFVEKYLYGES